MDTYKEIARTFKALCDENRVRILDMLRGGEQCACMLLDELNISQPTLSHHMKILCDSGLVNGRKDGKWMHYSISDEGRSHSMKTLSEITDVKEQNDQQNRCCGQ